MKKLASIAEQCVNHVQEILITSRAIQPELPLPARSVEKWQGSGKQKMKRVK